MFAHSDCTSWPFMNLSVVRKLERAATAAANAAWPVVQYVNSKFDSKAIQPKWAPAPLLKSKERTFPVLGWPRTTDSLCPTCVKETDRKSVV